VQNDSAEGVATLRMEAKPRGTDPLSFTQDDSVSIVIADGTPRVGLPPLSGETIQYKLEWNSGASNYRRITVQNMTLLVMDMAGG